MKEVDVLSLNLENRVSRIGVFRYEVRASVMSLSDKFSYHSISFDDIVYKEAYVTYTSPKNSDKNFALLDVDVLHHHIRDGFINIQIPIVGLMFPLGLDGSTRTIEYGWANIGYARISWWTVPPPAWKRLDDWFSTFTQFLDVELSS